MLVMVLCSSPVSEILTTATILTLYVQVHKVLSHSAILAVGLADVAALVLEAGVVEDQNIVSNLRKWWKIFVLALPLVLRREKLTNHE